MYIRNTVFVQQFAVDFWLVLANCDLWARCAPQSKPTYVLASAFQHPTQSPGNIIWELSFTRPYNYRVFFVTVAPSKSMENLG